MIVSFRQKFVVIHITTSDKKLAKKYEMALIVKERATCKTALKSIHDVVNHFMLAVQSGSDAVFYPEGTLRIKIVIVDCPVSIWITSNEQQENYCDSYVNATVYLLRLLDYINDSYNTVPLILHLKIPPSPQDLPLISSENDRQEYAKSTASIGISQGLSYMTPNDLLLGEGEHESETL
ncbi:hypothetical protein BDF20DRAFT_988416 [Mycotypha africana]|uniref:uncharacterized protein n=1 Tax=Mycotypha africana TaxID=64632 RepID=UPI0023008C3C|nr:uncharacterized protein BDF20DRAFT_988416 [Mycotypha africana]KAI8977467.1 hypothetical protein BDF20DRAFT_988416 [Mycotypha africana]